VVRNSPLGGCRGDGKDARGVTAILQVAGAHLAYHFLPVSDTEHQGKDNPNFKYKASGRLIGQIIEFGLKCGGLNCEFSHSRGKSMPS
jgi:hypothetical protein